MLRASHREMLKAYRTHKSHCGACDSPPLRLLLTYAVECGIKVLLMEHYKVGEYQDLPANAQIGHDIRAGLKELRATGQVRVVSTAHGKNPQEPVYPCDLHQAFRYGIPLDMADDVTADLQQILSWIDERLK